MSGLAIRGEEEREELVLEETVKVFFFFKCVCVCIRVGEGG